MALPLGPQEDLVVGGQSAHWCLVAYGGGTVKHVFEPDDRVGRAGVAVGVPHTQSDIADAEELDAASKRTMRMGFEWGVADEPVDVIRAVRVGALHAGQHPKRPRWRRTDPRPRQWKRSDIR